MEAVEAEKLQPKTKKKGNSYLAAFTLFLNEYKEKMEHSLVERTRSGDVKRQASEQWAALSGEQKAVYLDKVARRHAQEQADGRSKHKRRGKCHNTLSAAICTSSGASTAAMPPCAQRLAP